MIEQQVDMRQTFYERNHVPVFRGQARFVDPHTIEVEHPDNGRERFTARKKASATVATSSVSANR